MNTYRSQSRRTQIICLLVATLVTLGLFDIVCGSMLFPSSDATAHRAAVIAAEAARASELRAQSTPIEVASTPDLTR